MKIHNVLPWFNNCNCSPLLLIVAGFSALWVDEHKTRFRTVRQYLKSDFKLHVQENNSCPDHCWTYALSPKDSCNHPHDVHCEICDDLRLLLNEVEFSISSVDTKYK